MNKTILLFAALLISSCHHLLKPEKVDERCQVVFDKVRTVFLQVIKIDFFLHSSIVLQIEFIVEWFLSGYNSKDLAYKQIGYSNQGDLHWFPFGS